MISKSELDLLLQIFHVQPVGRGYIDCICPIENAGAFISELTKRGLKANGFTWWCHVTEEHEACGLGGPKSLYEDGWYSEIEMCNVKEFSDNNAIIKYLTQDWLKSSDYRPCFTPAFWLDVPKDWKNTLYK